MSQGFRNLNCWQRSKTLAVSIYRFTDHGPLARDFVLRDQMRRAAISVCSNLAEGDARQTNKESVQFFFVAKGSLAELSAQLEVAAAVHGLPEEEIAKLTRECEEIAAMVRGLIDHRRHQPPN
jgi:four helix bundle protein